MIHVAPELRTLAEDEIRSILYRNMVGRLVFIRDGEADVRPIHFAFSGENIYARTSPSATFLDAALSAKRVAFEVDEVETVYRWKSVIARGPVRALDPEGSDAAEWDHAVTLLRRVVKNAFADSLDGANGVDPLPDRSVVLRIGIEELTGRASA